MKKRYILGSAIVALLMLVSTQTMFMNNVKSWPSEHEGDASVGSMWVSELNTTSALQNVKNVSIGHASATDDWVKWLAGVGIVKADWAVDIENKHPEYWIRFTLSVFNIDDNNSEIGNATFMKTYNANTSYDESGTLQVLVEFGSSFLATHTNATLLCYLDAVAILNNTAEAVNFTSWGQDRCVVGVSLDSSETFEPYSRFTTEANEEWPNTWAWFEGWDTSGRFADEEDMLNNQTVIITGNGTEPEITGDWKLGDLCITLKSNNRAKVGWFDKNENAETKKVKLDSGEFSVNPYIDVHVRRKSKGNRHVDIRWIAFREDVLPIATHKPYKQRCPAGEYPNYRTTPVTYQWIGNFDEWDYDFNDEIKIEFGFIWPVVEISKIRFFGNFYIEEDGPGSVDPPVENCYYWEDSCVYQNGTFDLDVSSSTSNGITTVQADITEVLQSSNETVYSFAGDRGETRVDFTI